MQSEIEHPAYGVLRPVTSSAAVLLAENPSPMTLDGTNSWVLRAAGHEGCVVVDPGPDDDAHLGRLADRGPIELILLTHRHPDHTDGAAALARRTGAPARGMDPGFVVDAEPLTDGETLRAGGLDLRVLHTPGHTDDSVCLVIDDDAVLTGDTILGRGTTVLGDHAGALGDYLASLRLLAELPTGRPVLPGHGPDLADAAGIAGAYLRHREERLDQVRAALRELGDDDPAPRRVVEIVYADVDRELWPAADASVAAQLEYLRGR